MATRPARGRRARFSLRAIIRGWPWYYETDPVFPNEVLLRTVPNSIGYYTKAMGKWAINPNAFEPARDDTDGISLFREDFVTKEQLGRLSRHANGVRVARLVARECTTLQLSLSPAPDPDWSPGHMVIPELSAALFFVKRTPQTKPQIQRIKDLAQELAQIATRHEIYIPDGMPDPVVRSAMAAKPKIEFVEIRPASARDGGQRAASYVLFLVAAKEVAVEVYNSALVTHDGILPSEKTKVAAQTFLESEVKRLGVDNLPEKLVLDEPAMDTVLSRLGWPSRF